MPSVEAAFPHRPGAVPIASMPIFASRRAIQALVATAPAWPAYLSNAVVMPKTAVSTIVHLARGVTTPAVCA